MSKHERFTTAVNDSTGDLIKTKASNQQAYAESWERIFGKKENEHPHNSSGVRYTGMMLPETTAATQVAHKLTQDDVEVSVETPNGKVVAEGYVQEGVEQFIPFMEEEPTVLVFTEQLLPSGIIGDEE